MRSLASASPPSFALALAERTATLRHSHRTSAELAHCCYRAIVRLLARTARPSLPPPSRSVSCANRAKVNTKGRVRCCCSLTGASPSLRSSWSCSTKPSHPRIPLITVRLELGLTQGKNLRTMPTLLEKNAAMSPLCSRRHAATHTAKLHRRSTEAPT